MLLLRPAVIGAAVAYMLGKFVGLWQASCIDLNLQHQMGMSDSEAHQAYNRLHIRLGVLMNGYRDLQS